MGFTRDKIRARDRRTESFPIEALGDSVTLRMFSAAQRAELMGKFNVAAASTEPEDRARHQQDITAKVVQLTWVGEDDCLLYGPDELDALQDELAPEALDEIANRAMVFTGMASDDDADTRRKKSKGNRNGGGTSGSA